MLLKKKAPSTQTKSVTDILSTSQTSNSLKSSGLNKTGTSLHKQVSSNISKENAKRKAGSTPSKSKSISHNTGHQPSKSIDADVSPPKKQKMNSIKEKSKSTESNSSNKKQGDKAKYALVEESKVSSKEIQLEENTHHDSGIEKSMESIEAVNDDNQDISLNADSVAQIIEDSSKQYMSSQSFRETFEKVMGLAEKYTPKSLFRRVWPKRYAQIERSILDMVHNSPAFVSKDKNTVSTLKKKLVLSPKKNKLDTVQNSPASVSKDKNTMSTLKKKPVLSPKKNKLSNPSISPIWDINDPYARKPNFYFIGENSKQFENQHFPFNAKVLSSTNDSSANKKVVKKTVDKRPTYLKSVKTAVKDKEALKATPKIYDSGYMSGPENNNTKVTSLEVKNYSEQSSQASSIHSPRPSTSKVLSSGPSHSKAVSPQPSTSKVLSSGPSHSKTVSSQSSHSNVQSPQSSHSNVVSPQLSQNSQQSFHSSLSRNNVQQQNSQKSASSSQSISHLKSVIPKRKRNDIVSKSSNKSPIDRKRKDLVLDEIPEPEIQIMGTWVECTKCSKWRFLSKISDPADVDEKWICSMNTIPGSNCKEPQEDIEDVDDYTIFNKYTLGSLVWARVSGWCFWPAMVDVDPDVGTFYWLEALTNDVSNYHVTFMDKDVSRAWVDNRSIKAFKGVDELKDMTFRVRTKDYRKAVTEAAEIAERALHLNLKDRVSKFGFYVRWNGKSNIWTKDSDKKHISKKCPKKVKVDLQKKKKAEILQQKEEIRNLTRACERLEQLSQLTLSQSQQTQSQTKPQKTEKPKTKAQFAKQQSTTTKTKKSLMAKLQNAKKKHQQRQVSSSSESQDEEVQQKSVSSDSETENQVPVKSVSNNSQKQTPCKPIKTRDAGNVSEAFSNSSSTSEEEIEAPAPNKIQSKLKRQPSFSSTQSDEVIVSMKPERNSRKLLANSTTKPNKSKTAAGFSSDQSEKSSPIDLDRSDSDEEVSDSVNENIISKTTPKLTSTRKNTIKKKLPTKIDTPDSSESESKTVTSKSKSVSNSHRSKTGSWSGNSSSNESRTTRSKLGRTFDNNTTVLGNEDFFSDTQTVRKVEIDGCIRDKAPSEIVLDSVVDDEEERETRVEASHPLSVEHSLLSRFRQAAESLEGSIKGDVRCPSVMFTDSEFSDREAGNKTTKAKKTRSGKRVLSVSVENTPKSNHSVLSSRRSTRMTPGSGEGMKFIFGNKNRDTPSYFSDPMEMMEQ